MRTLEHVLQLSQDCLHEGNGVAVLAGVLVGGEEVLVDAFEHLLIVGPSTSQQCFGEINDDAGLFFEAWFFVALLIVLQLLELLLEGDGEFEPLGVDLILWGLPDLAVKVNHSPRDIL
jgi:hypothetical protein